MADIIDYDHGISAIDARFERPRLNAIHLVVDGGRAAVIDTGTNHAVPIVLEALRQKGIAPESVDWIVLTHIHLDHAGGAGRLAAALPNARVTVHPRGARHMVDPSRLWASTLAVYGEATAHRMYGEIVPLPAGRIVETPDGASIRLGGRELTFHDTPGHARHQVCVHDSASGHVFAGDTFGLSYREVDVGARQFVFPTTSPTQWEPQAHHRSVALIERLARGAVYVTHFSQVRDVPRLAADLHRLIDAHAALAEQERDAGAERHARLRSGVAALVLAEAKRQGWTLGRERVLEVFGVDIELNAQGLGAWLDARGA
ncbi:MAG: MBL fold metallo-hydrolase [Burkholderiales bacterium]|nr:MBL fold metallo-hydrolase [Burkholderiales bacterium]